MASQMPCPGTRLSFPLPSPPSPSSLLQWPQPCPVPQTCEEPRSRCFQTTPSSQTSSQRRRATLRHLRSSFKFSGGQAGSQTRPCQGAGHRAGRGSTRCTGAFCTMADGSSFLPRQRASSSPFCGSTTILLWRATTESGGRRSRCSDISCGGDSRQLSTTTC